MKAKVNWIRDLFPFLPSAVPCCCFEWNQALRDSVCLCVCVREIQKWEELQVTGKWVWKKYYLVWVRKCQKMNKQANFRISKHIFLVHLWKKDLIWISCVCITRKLFKIFCGLKCSGFRKRKSETHRTHSLLSHWEMFQQITETHHLYTHTPGRGSRRLRKGVGQRWQELSGLHDSWQYSGNGKFSGPVIASLPLSLCISSLLCFSSQHYFWVIVDLVTCEFI